MSLVIVETVAEQPITDEYLHEADEVALPCLQARSIHWRYSLLSKERNRMICTFDAPDAASVRDAYAKLGFLGRSIWTGELIQPEGAPQDGTDLCVMEVRYPAHSETGWNEIHQTFLQSCTARGAQWLRSYLSLDRTRMIYELTALSTEPLQDVRDQVDCDRIWLGQRLQAL